MKVHFSAPSQDFKAQQYSYEAITAAIRESGHTLAREWLNDLTGISASYYGTLSQTEWEQINEHTLQAVDASDAVIVAATVSSYSMGYISAYALSKKKPLLVLFRDQPVGYILESKNKLKRVEIFDTDDDLREKVKSFLADVDVDANNLRFNMVLDRQIYNFLNWESVHTGKTKAQIIRDLLKSHIADRE